MFIWNTRCCCGLELWGRVSCLCQVRLCDSRRGEQGE
ncbi:hypothetical protein SLEP1_g24599 [Rubroshorea leprosula]|uniref:Uncharacterized protein n=1 Tax=Rubroshorea leprosula TaxID=152421 RepID=A0AAV5JPY0_9ROSI|nr:hypothetical protein SLEP1_g24599 [Rubroshorea leprosula]